MQNPTGKSRSNATNPLEQKNVPDQRVDPEKTKNEDGKVIQMKGDEEGSGE